MAPWYLTWWVKQMENCLYYAIFAIVCIVRPSHSLQTKPTHEVLMYNPVRWELGQYMVQIRTWFQNIILQTRTSSSYLIRECWCSTQWPSEVLIYTTQWDENSEQYMVQTRTWFQTVVQTRTSSSYLIRECWCSTQWNVDVHRTTQWKKNSNNTWCKL